MIMKIIITAVINDPPPRQNIRLVAVQRMKKNKSFDDLRELDKKVISDTVRIFFY